MHRVLVVGGSGFIGSAIIKLLNEHENIEVYGTYFSNNDMSDNNLYCKLSINEPSELERIMHLIEPQSIISCLRGDFNKQLQLHAIMAEYLSRTGGSLYYCSTANVFDNDLSKPHYESDQVDSSNEEIMVYPKLHINTITDVKLAKQIAYVVEKRLKGIFHFGSTDTVSHKDFYMKLIGKISDKRVQVKDSLEEVGYFSILSSRKMSFQIRIFFQMLK